MQAYLIKTNTVIEPFGDPVGQTLLLDRPLQVVQDETLREAGCEPAVIEGPDRIGTPTAPYLVLEDRLYFSRALLAEFLERARFMGGTAPVRLVVKKGLFTRLMAVVQDVPQDEETFSFPMWYVPGGTFRPEEAAVVVLDIDEDSYEGHFPRHMIKKEGYRFCVTSRPVMTITHPLHLALANVAANFARLAEQKKMPLWQKLATALKARSLNKFHVLAAISQIHPEAEVHPTAVIEGSVIGKGAKIGAYAVVRFSYVGERAFVDDHAGLKFSVVGNEAYIANNCVLFFTVVYPRAFLISGSYQFTLFGYDSAMFNAIPSDYRLDGEPISVLTARGIENTGLRFVGSVIGHRTKIAAGVIIAPGRLIPNDLQIFPDPARVITRVPAGVRPHTTLYLVNGRLQTLDELAAARSQ